ncbi:MAG TPA: pyridoxal-phosphate dependent enzyme [Candidatus Limnocylindria bacterium]|nr:pyridoxal-phosphate dependent enzyme [Candidatus Limnocylindria bacterium]
MLRTPLLSSRALGERVGAAAHLKAESLQRTGSFKARGAIYAVGALAPAERAGGIVTMSAGNHAAAVAYAARSFGARVIVAMPETAPATKVAATRAYGAEIRFAPDTTKLMPIVEELRGEGFRFVHPWDDVIPGTGTIGLEIVEDVPDVDLVVVPVGGGGLISGVATAVTARRRGARVVGVQPQGAAAMRRSLDAGTPVRLERTDTIADGCTAPSVGVLALEIVQRLVDDVVLVSEDAIREGIRFVFERARLVVEPAGAVAVAALLAGSVRPRSGERVVAVLSGANIDAARFAGLLTA